jgi:hypothetical protein
MIGVVIYFLGMAHQLLPERPLIRGGDVSEKFVGLVEGYRVGGLPRSHYCMDAGVRFAAEQSEPFSLSPCHRGRLDTFAWINLARDRTKKARIENLFRIGDRTVIRSAAFAKHLLTHGANFMTLEKRSHSRRQRDSPAQHSARIGTESFGTLFFW